MQGRGHPPGPAPGQPPWQHRPALRPTPLRSFWPTGYGTSLSWTLRLMFGLVFWFVLNGLLPCPLTERWMLRTVMDDDGPHGTGRVGRQYADLVGGTR